MSLYAVFLGLDLKYVNKKIYMPTLVLFSASVSCMKMGISGEQEFYLDKSNYDPSYPDQAVLIIQQNYQMI